jgi:putative ABC transport system permease protein
MNTASLAVRNLLRNRRRSLATLLALAIGAAALLLFGGYIANIRYSMQTAYVRTGGHLQVQHADFFLYGSGNPTAYGIVDVDRLLTAIRNDEELQPMIAVATPALQFLGIAGNYDAGVSRTVLGIGYVAADVARMRDWNDFGINISFPPFLLNGAPRDAALIGVGLARVLLLCEPLGVKDCPRPEASQAGTGASLPADIAALAESDVGTAKPAAGPRVARLELLASQSRGSPNVAAVNVLAAESQGFKELDEILVVLQLPQAQQLVYGRAPPRATSLMIQLKHSSQTAAAAARLRELLRTIAPKQNLSVLDFETLNPFYVQSIQLFNTIFGFIFVLIGGIVLFMVSNTMTAAVVERTVEIGTLRAVGLRRQGIRQLFVAEGFLLGIAGAMVGTAFAFLVAFVVNISALTWLPPGSSQPLPLNIRVWGETSMLATTILGLIAIATVSAWWPAYRAAKLSIVDALRHA